MGYPSPIQPDREHCNRDYDNALRFCVEHIESIAICAGTHNENSSRLLTKLMREHQIPNDHPSIWFSQLLGMSDHLSGNLANSGYQVAKYVPYGPVISVLPYLIRRAQENTSIAGQTGLRAIDDYAGVEAPQEHQRLKNQYIRDAISRFKSRYGNLQKSLTNLLVTVPLYK